MHAAGKLAMFHPHSRLYIDCKAETSLPLHEHYARYMVYEKHLLTVSPNCSSASASILLISVQGGFRLKGPAAVSQDKVSDTDTEQLEHPGNFIQEFRTST